MSNGIELREVVCRGVYGGNIMLQDNEYDKSYHVEVEDKSLLTELKILERCLRPKVKITANIAGNEITHISFSKSKKLKVKDTGFIKVTTLGHIKPQVVDKEEVKEDLIDSYLCTVSEGSYSDTIKIKTFGRNNTIEKEISICHPNSLGIVTNLLQDSKNPSNLNGVSIRLKNGKVTALMIGMDRTYRVKEVTPRVVEETKPFPDDRTEEVELLDLNHNEYFVVKLKDSDSTRYLRFTQVHAVHMCQLRLFKQMNPDGEYKVMLRNNQVRMIEIYSPLSSFDIGLPIEEVHVPETEQAPAFKSVVKEFEEMVKEYDDEKIAGAKEDIENKVKKAIPSNVKNIYCDVDKVCNGLWLFTDTDKNEYLVGSINNVIPNEQLDGMISSYSKAGGKLHVLYDPSNIYNSAINIVQWYSICCLKIDTNTVGNGKLIMDKQKHIFLKVGNETALLANGSLNKEMKDKLNSTKEIDVDIYYSNNYDLVVYKECNHSIILDKDRMVKEDVKSIECVVKTFGNENQFFVLRDVNANTSYFVNTTDDMILGYIVANSKTVHVENLNSDLCVNIQSNAGRTIVVKLTEITGNAFHGNIEFDPSKNYMFVKSSRLGYLLLVSNENKNRYFKADFINKQEVTFVEVVKDGKNILLSLDKDGKVTELQAELMKPKFIKGSITSIETAIFTSLEGDSYNIRPTDGKKYTMVTGRQSKVPFVAYELKNSDTYLLTNPLLDFNIEVTMKKVQDPMLSPFEKVKGDRLTEELRRNIHYVIDNSEDVTNVSETIDKLIDGYIELSRCHNYYNGMVKESQPMGGSNDYNPYLSQMTSSKQVEDELINATLDAKKPMWELFGGECKLSTDDEVKEILKDAGIEMVEQVSEIKNDTTPISSEKINTVMLDALKELHNKKPLVPLVPKRTVKTSSDIYVHLDIENVYKMNNGDYRASVVTLDQPYPAFSHIGEPLFRLCMGRVSAHNATTSSLVEEYNKFSRVIDELIGKNNRDDNNIFFSFAAMDKLSKIGFKFDPVKKERHFVSISRSIERLTVQCKSITYLSPLALKLLNVLSPEDKLYPSYRAYVNFKLPQCVNQDVTILHFPSDNIRVDELTIPVVVNADGEIVTLDMSKSTTLYQYASGKIPKELKRDIKGIINSRVYFTKGFIDRHKGHSFIKIDREHI